MSDVDQMRIKCPCGWEVEGHRLYVGEVFDKHAAKCYAFTRNAR